MKKRFRTNSLWKIVFSLSCTLLLLTNCNEEEEPLKVIEPTTNKTLLPPSIEEAKLYFEQNSSRGASIDLSKNNKIKNRKYFINWKNSRVVRFNKNKGTDILYTPIIFDKKGMRIKSFLASLRDDKSNLKSVIFTIIYREHHTNEAFSGYLFQNDLEGNVQKIYSYDMGLLQNTYVVKKSKAKSNTVAKEPGEDDCDPETWEEWLMMMEMYEIENGGGYHRFDCITIVGSSGSDDEGPSDVGDPTYFNPDIGLEGGSISIIGGSGSGSTSTTDSVPYLEGEWWYEETEIVPLEVASDEIITTLPLLSVENVHFVQDPSNHSTNVLILNFLQAHSNSVEAQEFAVKAIDALMNGHEVDFDTMTITCKEGYVKDKNGNCVEKPCENDPIKNPTIAAQKGKSGTKGALFGCTRYGGNCTGGTEGRNKQHDGIDLKNSYGSPIYAMHDGFIYSSKYDSDGAGYYTRIQSTVNGETILTEYFHLQKDNRITQNQPGQPLIYVKAGDIIGYQGDSGNLADAIKNKTVDSHVHIEVRLHDGSSKWGYDNYSPVNPRDYFKTSIDENGISTKSDCN